MHSSEGTFLFALCDRDGAFEDDFAIRRDVNVVGFAFNQLQRETTKRPYILSLRHSVGNGMDAAMTAMGGAPTAIVKGTSLPVFCHSSKILAICCGFMISLAILFLSWIIALAIDQFVHSPLGCWTIFTPIV